MQLIIMLVLLTLTLSFGLTAPWGGRLAPAALAQAFPAQAPGQGEQASSGRTAIQVTPSPDGITSCVPRRLQGQLGCIFGSPGNQPRKLVQGIQPTLSPDGKKLAYGLGKKGITGGGIFGLMVLDLATGNVAIS